MTVWRMRFACWIAKATNTHSEYVILIACPLPKWSRKPASLLRYVYILFYARGNLFLFNIRTQTGDFEEWVLSDILVSNSWEVRADWNKFA
jgi:hypothetical protein